MKRTIVNVLLLAGTLAALGASWMLHPDNTRRNFEVLPGMVSSVPYDSFAQNPNYRDGKTLQPLVRGVVVRGFMPLHYAATPDDAKRAGVELASPVARNDAAALARGEAVYLTYCEVCHGLQGKGDGPVAQRGYPAPPSLLAPNALNLKDGQIFHILTYGQNNMPSYAAQVLRKDRWKVIAYVRTLQAQGAATPAAPVPPVTKPAGGAKS